MKRLTPGESALWLQVRWGNWLLLGAWMLWSLNSQFSPLLEWIWVNIFFWSSIAHLVVRRRNGRMLRNHEWRMCPYCRQLLVSLPDEGLCPECGKRYRAQQVEEHWRDRYFWFGGRIPRPESMK